MSIIPEGDAPHTRELGVEDARKTLGSLVVEAGRDDIVTYVRHGKHRMAAIVPAAMADRRPRLEDFTDDEIAAALADAEAAIGEDPASAWGSLDSDQRTALVDAVARMRVSLLGEADAPTVNDPAPY